MTPAAITRARAAAVELIRRADIVLAEVETDTVDGEPMQFVRPGANSGALRRMSLECTRALAEMRKP